MTWKKITQSFKEAIDKLTPMITNGDDTLDSMRCIYITYDNNIIYLHTVFDFIDAKLDEKAIKKFTLYQMITEK